MFLSCSIHRSTALTRSIHVFTAMKCSIIPVFTATTCPIHCVYGNDMFNTCVHRHKTVFDNVLIRKHGLCENGLSSKNCKKSCCLDIIFRGNHVAATLFFTEIMMLRHFSVFCDPDKRVLQCFATLINVFFY